MSTEPSRVQLPDGTYEDFWSADQLGQLGEDQFVKNMVHFREKRGITQGGLATRLQASGLKGMYQTTLSRIEKGERALKFHEALAIARTLGSSVAEMLQPTDNYALIEQLRAVNTDLRSAQDEIVKILHRVDRRIVEAVDIHNRLADLRVSNNMSAAEQESLHAELQSLQGFLDGQIQGFVDRAVVLYDQDLNRTLRIRQDEDESSET